MRIPYPRFGAVAPGRKETPSMWSTEPAGELGPETPRERETDTLFEISPLPMWRYDPTTFEIHEANPAAAKLYGWTREAMAGRSMLDLWIPDDRSTVIRLHVDLPARAHFGRWRHLRSDLRLVDVEIESHLMTGRGRWERLAIAQDVSYRKPLEDRVGQAERMELVGQLAVGIAHDFNNLAGAIVGYGTLLQRQVQDEAARARVEQMVKAGECASRLAHQLLRFSRRQQDAPAIVDLNDILAGMCPMLERILGDSITIAATPATEASEVLGDHGQLEQVLLNLVVNARDAMPGGGRLTIGITHAEVPAGQPPLEAGSYVVLAVGDTGTGIDADTREHLFEPFWTTKAVGTGVGLATVQRIVRESGGQVLVESQPGQGTVFRVYLPRVAARRA